MFGQEHRREDGGEQRLVIDDSEKVVFYDMISIPKISSTRDLVRRRDKLIPLMRKYDGNTLY
jgi:hypothetical protein